MNMIRLYSILIIAALICGCEETPEAVYDNPFDPNNTSAPLFTPYSVNALYLSDTLMSIIWMDDNLTVTGYRIERMSKTQSTFTVIASPSRDQLEKIGASKTWTVWRYYDTGVKRSDSSYTYRIKTFHNSVESQYSEGVTVTFP